MTRINREDSARENVFQEPDWLHIPETVTARFKSDGQSLRWIRLTIKGNDDVQNVGRRMAEGWTIVQWDEVPEMHHSSMSRDEGRYSGAVCRGDLALAKMNSELAESRQEFYENKSRNMVRAVNQQLMSQSDSRMPISNNSKTSVTKGRQPNFQD